MEQKPQEEPRADDEGTDEPLNAMVDRITRTPQRPSDRSPGDIRRDGERIKQMFSLKPIPEGHTNQARYLRNIREMGREFAIIIHENSPRCADQTLAVRCVREAVKWAEEAILREGLV